MPELLDELVIEPIHSSNSPGCGEYVVMLSARNKRSSFLDYISLFHSLNELNRILVKVDETDPSTERVHTNNMYIMAQCVMGYHAHS